MLDLNNTPASLYSVLPPEEARLITHKLEFHYTLKQGGWLNMAECELAVLAGQCLNRRRLTIDTLRDEIAAWEGPRNQLQTKIHWQFGTETTRVKFILSPANPRAIGFVQWFAAGLLERISQGIADRVQPIQTMPRNRFNVIALPRVVVRLPDVGVGLFADGLVQPVQDVIGLATGQRFQVKEEGHEAMRSGIGFDC